MDEGYLVLHELDACDVRMVGEFLTDFKDLLPPRVPPPRATNRLAGDQPGYARQINIRKQKKSDLFEPPKNERVTTHCSAAPNKKTRQDNRIAGASGHVDKWHRAVLMPARERPFSYILFILSILSNQETGTRSMSSGTGRIGTVETEDDDLGLRRSELHRHHHGQDGQSSCQSNWTPGPFQELHVLC